MVGYAEACGMCMAALSAGQSMEDLATGLQGYKEVAEDAVGCSSFVAALSAGDGVQDMAGCLLRHAKVAWDVVEGSVDMDHVLGSSGAEVVAVRQGGDWVL